MKRFIQFVIAALISTAVASDARAQVVSLLVGNQSGYPGLDRYHGSTGAFLGAFGNVASGSAFSYFKYGGPSTSLFVQQFPNVLQFDGHTGEFINTFITQPGIQFAFGPDKNLYRLEPSAPGGPRHIGKYDGASGVRLGTFVDASVSGLNNAAGSMRFGPDGNLYVDNGNTILRFNGTTGVPMGPFIAPGGSPLAGILEALFTSNGRLLAVGGGTGTIDKIFQFDATSGAFLGVFASGNGLDAPIGLAQGPDGNIYAASTFGNKVHRFDLTSGAFLGDFVSNTVHGSPAYIAFTPFPVPEPTSLALVCVGAGAYALKRLRHRPESRASSHAAKTQKRDTNA